MALSDRSGASQRQRRDGHLFHQRFVAGRGFQRPAIGDPGYRGKRPAKAGAVLGIPIQPIARGRNSVFIPTEIAWIAERSFSWITRYGRLDTIVERTKEHLIAFDEDRLHLYPSTPPEASDRPGRQRVTSTNTL